MATWHLKDSRAAGMVAHPSTELALHALSTLHLSPSTILDIGCGSGLLCLAACGRWPEARILAADISEQAVADATENLRHIGIKVLRADGLSHPEIAGLAPYSLILCNLLAEKIIGLLPELHRHLAPGGQLIVSGILAWQLPQLMAAAQTLHFEITEELSHGQWRALIVQKPS